MDKTVNHEFYEWRNEVEPYQSMYTYIVDHYDIESIPLIAITVKTNSKLYCNKSKIDEFIKAHVSKYFDVWHTVYELDSCNVLHAHLICQATIAARFHKAIRYWHQDVVNLKTKHDAICWLKYLTKVDQNYIIDKHHSIHNNMFDEISA